MFLFNVRNGSMSPEEIELHREAAAQHDVEFVYAELPEGPRSWFSCRNLGNPFDQQTAHAVRETLLDLLDHMER